MPFILLFMIGLQFVSQHVEILFGLFQVLPNGFVGFLQHALLIVQRRGVQEERGCVLTSELSSLEGGWG
jgi:hypothetical protein